MSKPDETTAGVEGVRGAVELPGDLPSQAIVEYLVRVSSHHLHEVLVARGAIAMPCGMAVKEIPTAELIAILKERGVESTIEHEATDDLLMQIMDRMACSVFAAIDHRGTVALRVRGADMGTSALAQALTLSIGKKMAKNAPDLEDWKKPEDDNADHAD